MTNIEKQLKGETLKYKAFKVICKYGNEFHGGDKYKALKAIEAIFDEMYNEKAQLNDPFGFMSAFDEVCKPVDEYLLKSKRGAK